MYPAWATDEYANRRTTFVWRSAIRLPTDIVSTASTQNIGCHTSCWPKKPTKTSSMIATKPAAFDATERNAVMGVGAPWYVSGAHVWNGTADTLNANPTTQKITPSVTIAGVLPLPSAAPISVSTVDPVTPKISDIPYSMIAVANTPIR